MVTLSEIIIKRYSCRSFQPEKINKLVIRELHSFISSNDIGLWGEKIELQIIERDPSANQQMKLDYGIITNHNTYVAGIVRNDFLSRMSYGYVVEKVVIKATALGLNSCWIGYFDSSFFPEINIPDNFEIPSIVIIGCSAKESISNRIIRMSIKASKRHEWSKLFFQNDFSTPLAKNQAAEYKESFEMLMLAPSSGNTQPWRVAMGDENKYFHFYKKIISQRYEAKGLHDVDLGIALAHFELVSRFNRLTGMWQRLENKDVPKNIDHKYMISWVMK